MLVRRRVEDRFHTLLLQYLRQPVGIADAAQRGHQLQFRVPFPEFVLDPEEVAFRLIECHQARRLEARHLTAQLRANRTRGAGDQDGTAGDARFHMSFVQAHLLPA